MRKILLTSLALAVAATPALAHRGGDAPPDGAAGPKHDRPTHDGPKHDRPKHDGPKHDRPHKAKGPKGTHHLLHACVTADATADALELAVLGGNRHMRRVLDGADAFTAALDEDTVVRLVGRARHLPAGSTPKRLPRVGTHADLTTGDRVIVRFRARRGLEPGEMPAAFRVIDRGPGHRCAPPPEEPTPEEPEEPTGPEL